MISFRRSSAWDIRWGDLLKLFLRYLRSKAGALALLVAFALILTASFRLYHLPTEAVLYPAALCLALGAGYLALDFARTRRRHRALSQLRGLEEALPEARDIEAADYRALAGLLRRERREAATRAAAEARAMADYYTLWAHQVKTPIAAMRLRLQGRDSAEARELLSDLGRIERYVEMALTYQRLEGDGTDYVLREVSLDGVLRPVFKQFAGEFIGRKLRLDYAPADVRVLTDEKWLSFVVGQVLSNALKYTPEGTISVYMEAPCTLCVRDTGIGIAPEDLPRVFEQSYTGPAGRADRRASGLGLYLCRRVCDNLGHSITIESAPGEGTTVRIDLISRKIAIE